MTSTRSHSAASLRNASASTSLAPSPSGSARVAATLSARERARAERAAAGERAERTERTGGEDGGEDGAARKLALIEQLQACDDARAAARCALAFLGERGVVERAVCAVVDGERSQLVGVAGLHVDESEVEALSVDLGDRDHPLVLALEGAGPVTLSGGGRGRRGRALAGGAASSAGFTLDFGVLGAAAAGNGGGGGGNGSAHGAGDAQSALHAVPLVARGVDPEGSSLGLILAHTPRAPSPASPPSPPSPPLPVPGSQGHAEVPALLVWCARALSGRLVQLDYARIRGAKRKLLRERSLLHSIINAVTDPILLTDEEGRIVVANTTAEALLSAQDQESEGRRRAIALNNMLFSAALFTRSTVETQRGGAGGPAHGPGPGGVRELLLVDPVDGKDLLFELLSTSVGDGFVSILRNVTDLRHATEEIEGNYRKLRLAEAEVRAERDRLDLIINSVADPILVADPQGRIILTNTPAERLFTAPDEGNDAELRRVRANDAVFSSFVSNLYALQELRWSAELGLVDPRSGASVPVEAFAGKVMSTSGEVTAVVTILHDRTEAIEKAQLYEQVKRHSEELGERVQEATAELVTQNETLRRQALALEQASNAKSQFLANVSHELRTPLNAIIGYTQLLLAGAAGPVEPHVTKRLERVDSNAKNLLAIINDLLDVARIEAGKMPVKIDGFELGPLLAEVLAELEPLIARSGLAVDQTIDLDVPAVRSDRQKVKQIVLNLVSNALKFTREGSVRALARFDGKHDEVGIAIVDTGAGIPAEEQERIFEDFRQAADTFQRHGGTGLGLAICRRLAKTLGGRITVQSTLGKGSTFTLFLPRKGPRR